MLDETSDARDWPLAAASVGIAVLAIVLALLGAQPPVGDGHTNRMSVLIGILVLSSIGVGCGFLTLRSGRSSTVVTVAVLGIVSNAILESMAAIFLLLLNLPSQ